MEIRKTFWAIFLVVVAPIVQANSSQFIAKQYTEALGRAPDPGGWSGAQGYISQNGCSRATLQRIADDVFSSPEYDSRGYDNYEKVLTVYRAVANREPDPSGYAYWVNFLNAGNSVTDMVDYVFQSIDATMFSQMCGTLGYGWGTQAPLDNTAIPVNSAGIVDLATLQRALASAAPGSTVFLAQRAVIATASQILVPAGVTLATMGLPPSSQYAKQARIVRTALFGAGELDGSLVRVLSGGRVQSVWISGQRQNLGYAGYAVTVVLQSGTGTSIATSRIDNSSGWTTIIAHRYGSACSQMVVDNNLLTGYSNIHQFAPGYTDGISGNCEDITISANNIIDASDVGIILFPASLTSPQASQVYANSIVSAGVPAYAALQMTAMSKTDIDGNTSFYGAAIHDNTFWAAPDSHFDIGLAVGGMAWTAQGNLGIEGSFTANTNAGIATPMFVGIAVDGLVNTAVRDNALLQVAPKLVISDHSSTLYQFRCPTGAYLAHLDPSLGHATDYYLQAGYTSASVDACIGH